MSFQDVLKSWEGRTSSVRDSKKQASSFREEGNVFFRAGKLQDAIVSYSKSLEEEESQESLTNRALVFLKLGRLQEAFADSDRALCLNANNVKALVRRGTAKSGLGDHIGALSDFRLAQAFEPENNLLRSECSREEALIDAKKHVREESESDENSVDREKNSISSLAIGLNEQNSAVLVQALESLDSSLSIPTVAPLSAFSFSVIWRDLKGRNDLKIEFLTKTMQEINFVSCFNQSIEPDLFQDILLTLSGEELLKVLSYFSRMPSFALSKLMLPKKFKQRLNIGNEVDIYL